MKTAFELKPAVAKKIETVARHAGVNVEWLVNWSVESFAGDALKDAALINCAADHCPERLKVK